LSSLFIVCPITSTRRGHPFEVPLPAGLPISGVILVDQVKSLDRHVRRVEPAGRVPEAVIEDVVARLLPLLTGGRRV
jgi:mRNA interferase MazF